MVCSSLELAFQNPPRNINQYYHGKHLKTSQTRQPANIILAYSASTTTTSSTTSTTTTIATSESCFPDTSSQTWPGHRSALAAMCYWRALKWSNMVVTLHKQATKITKQGGCSFHLKLPTEMFVCEKRSLGHYK